ncbi:hypothetical protein TNCV_4776191 [Trichonephila clavipes]|nr:hypothetical protein TNCV_4776191 [Trichonephila clavipes]
MPAGRGSLVDKVTPSWLACHEFEPSAAVDSPCRETMHVDTVESSNFGVVWLRECQLRCDPRHLTMI